MDENIISTEEIVETASVLTPEDGDSIVPLLAVVIATSVGTLIGEHVVKKAVIPAANAAVGAVGKFFGGLFGKKKKSDEDSEVQVQEENAK